ncbi:MAG: hypothetical protein QXH16_09125, partial [Candidatus Bathyarchaeia archaeon]
MDLRRLVLQCFPNIRINDINILGFIASEGPSTYYDYKEKRRKIVSEMSGSTFQNRANHLLRSGFLMTERKKEGGRIKVVYSLTFKGKLAALASPLVEIEQIGNDILRELHLGSLSFESLKVVL